MDGAMALEAPARASLTNAATAMNRIVALTVIKLTVPRMGAFSSGRGF